MSRKPTRQKRQIASRDGRSSLSHGTGKFRQSARARNHGVLSAALADRAGLRFTIPAVIPLVLVVLLAGGSWLGWQVDRMHTEVQGERLRQIDLTRDNRELLARRDKLMIRERIIDRAAGLGLYPPRSEQVRKLGSR